jgi:hypothetical protein
MRTFTAARWLRDGVFTVERERTADGAPRWVCVHADIWAGISLESSIVVTVVVRNYRKDQVDAKDLLYA